jgi:hypothetical protein
MGAGMKDDLIGWLRHRGGESRVSLHWTYLEIAVINLEIARKADANQKLVEERFTRATRDAMKLTEIVGAEQEGIRFLECWQAANNLHGETKSRAIIASIVFSALMLEAYINNVARLRLSGFFREKLDVLDLPAKWVLVTKEAFTPGIKAEHSLVEQITRVQRQRNMLVHARPIHFNCQAKDWKGDPAEKYRIGVAKAEAAVQTCFAALEETRRLDPTFESEDYQYFLEWRDTDRVAKRILADEFEAWWTRMESHFADGH